MRTLVFCFFAFICVIRPYPVAAQDGVAGVKTLKEEQERFRRGLKGIAVDSAIVNPLARYFESEVNNIRTSLQLDAALPEPEKEKALRSLVYFMNELNSSLVQQRLAIYDIPAALKSYKSVLTALISHKPFTSILVPLKPNISQLLAATFSQYKEYPVLDEIAVYKRVASSPEFILQFVENKPGFRFADSLLLEAAAHDPWKLVFYLNSNKPGVQDKIRSTKNIYLQQIVSVSKDKNASELLPFLTQMAENTITPEEIIEKRTDVVKYFQLLVNTLKESVDHRNTSSIFIKPLRDGIKQKSLSFYVNDINELHSSADAVRFASVDGLRPEDIYYIITSCGEELYTSSYLGLYKRLMKHFKEQSADSLFDIVQYDNFHIFMRLAANYNVLADFLHKMSGEKMTGLVKRFIAGIETDANSGLERAMDIGDSFGGLNDAPEISGLIHEELKSNLNRCTSARQYLGIRLYGILLQVFDLVNEKGSLNKLWATLGNYEILKRDALENRNGEIVQLVLFYGDEDGVASYGNFLKLYTDSSKWKISKNANWVSIRSVSDRPLVIFANMPLDSEMEMDLRAQDSLIDFLHQQSLEPSVLIHRGHSYHLDKTLKRLTPSVKLAILGSCGGYNKAISIASISPDVQVIGSKKTGSKSINDPIIDAINETLLNGRDLLWPEIWNKLTTRFSKDELTLSLFNEYFSPSNNLSLFVLKLFVFHNRFV